MIYTAIMNYSITRLSIRNIVLKPRSSFVFLSTLMYYKLLPIIRKYFDISLNTEEKLLLFILSFSKDKKFLLNKLLFYTKPINEIQIKYKIDVELHSIVSHEVLPYYLVMVKSFIYFSTIDLPIVIHEDGSLTVDDILFIKSQIPNAVIIRFKKSTLEMQNILQKYPTLLSYRLKNHNNKINIMTTVDVPYYTKSKHGLYMDGDMLFFSKPIQLCKWLLSSKKQHEIYYMIDHSDCYVINKYECEKFFKAKYLSKFNMGILSYPKKSLDLKSLELYFNYLHLSDKDEIMVRDQTYFMMHFQQNKYKLIPLNKDKYLVYGENKIGEYIFGKRKIDTINCHYTSAVRNKIYDEAIVVLFRMRNFK